VEGVEGAEGAEGTEGTEGTEGGGVLGRVPAPTFGVLCETSTSGADGAGWQTIQLVVSHTMHLRATNYNVTYISSV
jgi:hypothetical protein